MSMDGNTCCKGAEPVEEEEREPDCSLATEKGEDDTHEKTSGIMLQYDGADADKLTYFGAKLNTNTKGEHRLVEVEEDGLAKQLSLKNDDVIIELNGADVTDVCHESLVLGLQDLGTKVQFVVNRQNETIHEQGRVYFRLAPAEGDVGCGGVSIASKKCLFIESTPGMRVNIDDFVLSSEDAFKALGKHVIEEATKSTLQITNWSGEIDLVIMRDGARFSSRGGKVCIYSYTQLNLPTSARNVTSYASVPTDGKRQYGVTFRGDRPGPLHVKAFPDFMKTRYTKFVENSFCFVLDHQTDKTVDITPSSNSDLHLTNEHNDYYDVAVLKRSTNGDLKLANSLNCSQRCIQKSRCGHDSDE